MPKSAPQAKPKRKSAAEKAASRIQWWRDAKFGMFVHWGPVSVEGTEIGWSRDGDRRAYWQGGGTVPPGRYDELWREFNPEKFDPDEWAAIAKDAGMGYLVFTTRHHDAFSMWDTKVSEYKITNPESPCRRDIVGLLAEATRKAGLRFGAYYSQPDWLHPDAFTERHEIYLDYIHEQVRELMTQYGRVDILWFDGLGKSAEDYGAKRMHKMVRKLQPQILINNRNGLAEDFDTPEQRVGTMQVDRPWESCITICRQWSWKPGDVMKSLEECLGVLISTITGDGNLLLNVGPMPDGRIEPRQVARLREIGDWLRENGEAVYGTRGGPFRNGNWGGATCRGSTIYIHLLQPPVGGILRLPPLPQKILKASALRSGVDVPFSQNADSIVLELGAKLFCPPVTILRLEMDATIEPGQALGLAGGQFEDISLYGLPCQKEASASVSSGSVSQDLLGRWTVRTESEPRPALTLDLGKICEITAVSAKATEHNAADSNSDLRISLSRDGIQWTECYRGSYGLPCWEVPVTAFIAGIHHPGVSARYVQLWIDHSNAPDSLRAGEIVIHAR